MERDSLWQPLGAMLGPGSGPYPWVNAAAASTTRDQGKRGTGDQAHSSFGEGRAVLAVRVGGTAWHCPESSEGGREGHDLPRALSVPLLPVSCSYLKRFDESCFVFCYQIRCRSLCDSVLKLGVFHGVVLLSVFTFPSR